MDKHWRRRLLAAAAAWLITAACTVTAFADGELIPVGETVGIQIKMEGVLVAGVTDVQTQSGAACPAREAGLQAGDVIVAIGGRTVHDAADLLVAVESMDGGPAQLSVKRDGQLRICPLAATRVPPCGTLTRCQNHRMFRRCLARTGLPFPNYYPCFRSISPGFRLYHTRPKGGPYRFRPYRPGRTLLASCNHALFLIPPHRGIYSFR